MLYNINCADLEVIKMILINEGETLMYETLTEEGPVCNPVLIQAPDCAAIVEILRLQYKPFLLLAAQLQTTHEQVQNLKEQYLSYRKVFLHSSVDVFEERRKKNMPGTSVSVCLCISLVGSGFCVMFGRN